MTGGRAGIRSGRGGSRRGTAGNGRERLGRSPGRSPRSVGRSAGRHSAQAAQPWATPRQHTGGRRCGGDGNRHLIVGSRRPRSRCRRTSCRCLDLHGHARSTGWPVESAALSARPVAVVNVDGPGYEPSPVPAAGLADGEPVMLGLRKPAIAPMSLPRSARRRPNPASRTRGPGAIVGPVIGGCGQPRVLAGAGAAREPVDAGGWCRRNDVQGLVVLGFWRRWVRAVWRRPVPAVRTAMARALRLPASTTRRLARVTAV